MAVAAGSRNSPRLWTRAVILLCALRASTGLSECKGFSSGYYGNDPFVTSINEELIHNFTNCTIIDGSLVITSQAFRGDPFIGVGPMDPSELSVLSTITEITGYLQVEGEHEKLTDLSFLHNLKTIQGRELYNQYSMVIFQTSLESLGLTSLQEVNAGKINIRHNKKLCYSVGDSVWDRILKNTAEQERQINGNRDQAECDADGKICSDQCNADGCWGFEANQCIKCANFEQDGKCVESCEATTNYTDKQCRPCHPQCDGMCNGPGSDNCTRCLNVKDGPFCKAACPPLKYPDKNNECQPCCCPPGYTPFQDACFKVYNQEKNYSQALQMCSDDGGLLAMPKSEEVDNFLLHLTSMVPYKNGFWLGLRESSTNGEWMWQDGTPHDIKADWNNWYPGEPNDLEGEDCGQYYLSNGSTRLTWSDKECASDFKFICQTQRYGRGTLDGSTTPPFGLIVGTSAGVVLALALGVAVVWFLRRRRERRRRDEDSGPIAFFSDDERRFNIMRMETIPLVPKRPQFDGLEVDPSRLTFGKILGRGAFGVVYRAVLTRDDVTKDVVVKTVKNHASEDDKTNFLEEIRAVVNLGVHENLLGIVGCTTVVEDCLYLITEYLPYGDLKNFLRKCQQTSERPQEYSNNFGVIEMYQVARQIARGMDYIARSRYVHGDLAARNVLVDEGLKVKISDFGLAEDIYSRGYRRQDRLKKVPWKWMAPERLQDGEAYTTASDVWSFGIVLYEIATLGGDPYSDIPLAQLKDRLRAGYRMPKPDICTDSMYDMMRQCWSWEPTNRPSFRNLELRLDKDLAFYGPEYVTAV